MITLHLTRVVKYGYQTCQTWMRSEGLSNDNMYHEQSLSRKEHAATAKGAISRTRRFGAGWKHPPDLFELGSFTATGCEIKPQRNTSSSQGASSAELWGYSSWRSPDMICLSDLHIKDNLRTLIHVRWLARCDDCSPNIFVLDAMESSFYGEGSLVNIFSHCVVKFIM